MSKWFNYDDLLHKYNLRNLSFFHAKCKISVQTNPVRAAVNHVVGAEVMAITHKRRDLLPTHLPDKTLKLL
jgi:hypothetical protein